jgi:hypothetical protein
LGTNNKCPTKNDLRRENDSSTIALVDSGMLVGVWHGQSLLARKVVESLGTRSKPEDHEAEDAANIVELRSRRDV